MLLDYVALGVIGCLPILIAANAILIGSIPGRIAKRRNHPWAAAVNVAGWIGLLTIALWPLALIWAFLPLPGPGRVSSEDSSVSSEDISRLEQRLAELETEVARLQTQVEESKS